MCSRFSKCSQTLLYDGHDGVNSRVYYGLGFGLLLSSRFAADMLFVQQD